VKRDTAIITAAIAAVLLLASRRARASVPIDPSLDVQFPDTPWHDAPEDVVEDPSAGSTEGFGTSGYDYDFNIILPTFEDYFSGPVMDSNTAAFLYAIRRSEHLALDVGNDMDYQTFFGGSTFDNMSDHPVNTREKRGVPLNPDNCRRLGYASGKCVSTAAGAYQFIKPTWDRLRSIAPRLADFSPASQDEAAVRLLAEIGALSRIQAGDITAAVQRASGSWASLPGSTAGQGGKTMPFVVAQYQAAGGVVA